MPNYYAHHVFGREVFSHLPATLQKTLDRERDAFEVGLYGPDPLFFSHPLPHSIPRHLAQAMHRMDVRPVAERLLAAVRDDLPLARGYAVGFLCHFALDSRCHYYIEERTHKSGLSHAGMEAEFDRALMLRDGLDPLHQTTLDRLRLPRSFYQTLSVVYPQVTPAQFVSGYRMFRRMCQIQTQLSGTKAHRTVNWVGTRYPKLSVVKGTVLTPLPNPLYDVSTSVLLQLLDEEVVSTAQAMSHFFTVVARGGRLDQWYDRPFSGQWTSEHRNALVLAIK